MRVEFGKKAKDAIRRIKNYTKASDDIEVVRHALAVYACILKARQKGYKCRMVNVHDEIDHYNLVLFDEGK